jgi:hypothetical protein
MPYPYDLPINLPIADKMEIGKRSYEEIDWLLEHGEIRSDLIWRYHKLFRPVPGVYQLWKGKNQDDPEKSSEQELVKTTAALQEMLTKPDVIQYWHWLADTSYDSFPYIRQQYHMPFLRKYLAIQCEEKRGVIARADGSYILVYMPGLDFLPRYHPTWEMIYYDDEGNILADYRKKKENPL